MKGRIVSPQICPYVDLKMYAFKTGFITWVRCKFIKHFSNFQDFIQMYHIYFYVNPCLAV
jgi:hypothetical protein